MNPALDHTALSTNEFSDFTASMASMSLEVPPSVLGETMQDEYGREGLLQGSSMLLPSISTQAFGLSMDDFADATSHLGDWGMPLLLGGSATVALEQQPITEGVDPSLHNGEFFRDVVESAIAAFPAEATGCPDSYTSSGFTSPSLADIFDVDAFFGTPESSTGSPGPFFESRASSISSSASPFGTSSEGSNSADELLVNDPDCNFEIPVGFFAPTLSAVGDSVLGKAYLAVGAAVVPSCLTGSSSRSSSCDPPSGSRKYHPYKQSSHRKRVSSASANLRVVDIWPQGKARNIQSQLDVSHFDLDSSDDGVLHCPVPHCNYVQCTGRKPDMKRHIETHRSKENQRRWVCCGVPVEHAKAYGIDDVSGVYWWRGWPMVGGCRMGFSRRDSLGRHINRKSCPCKGHPDMASELIRINQEALE
ncbi:uncharacterized protein B0H18DRAFT_1004021 [Fomitopsis serialis]|uniref:uncharacterized protein n=1 Tax=Fomitopsis serialis TaxID=139415 RepID=UPI002007AABB|nr:uncharacterized protein B0H18DRAFT_1004021 [Neoantrodia serialis]KAH9927311.1 hypothetical protein B0H18DRAFT_1004021 [Neoantrodia serialis]